jgi:hypothetical protein
MRKLRPKVTGRLEHAKTAFAVEIVDIEALALPRGGQARPYGHFGGKLSRTGWPPARPQALPGPESGCQHHRVTGGYL